MKPPVLTKADFYVRWRAGEFGNRGIEWAEQKDCLAYLVDNPGSLAAIRTVRSGGGPFYPNLNFKDIVNICYELRRAGYNDAEMHFSLMQPDHLILMQAYVSQSDRFIELDYNTIPGDNMRVAMSRAQHTFGAYANLLLRRHLCPSSYDDMMRLLVDYPDHVIEFSAYKIDVGIYPLRNTLIWEVRRY